MGTEITLDIAALTLDYSKNFVGSDHGVLFQAMDRKRIRSEQIDYDYFEENEEDPAPMEIGFTRKLKDILPRLDFLGFTREQARRDYLRTVKICLDEVRYTDDAEAEITTPDFMNFEEFCAFVAAHPIETLDDTFVEDLDSRRIEGRFYGDAAAKRLPHSWQHDIHAYSERSYFGRLINFLHPYCVLNVLAENADNKEADVVWQYGPLVENGWADESEFVPGARRNQTFLVAAEGSSDVHILKHAISILRPEIEDFFRFIDVTEGHPFSGAGSLVKFAEGLAKIDVHNQVVFLFDNDGEGFDACQRIKKISFPPNMRAIKLPELEQFRSFPTRGPLGAAHADINSRAAAIECYLDLNNAGGPSPQVVWTNYKRDLDIYHGALENKEVHTKAFLKQTAQSIEISKYDVTKLSLVLDALVAECRSIAESTFEEE